MSNNMIDDIRKKANAARDQFITTRAMIERNLSEFADRIKQADQELLKDIELPEVISAKTLLPSLYADRIDFEAIASEKELLIQKLEKIKAVQGGLIQEAYKILGMTA